MKMTVLKCLSLGFMLVILVFVSGNSIQNRDVAALEMCFPNGKMKALILSYDDGRVQDRQLVALMNKYHLIGTFHLNSNKLDQPDYLTKSEIKQLFSGHEVSIHSANHPGLTSLSKEELIDEIVLDQRELERLVGYKVDGMAYPFGDYNELVLEEVKNLSIQYARTVKDSYHFDIPSSFLEWHPTIHQFAKAYWKPNDPQNDQKELSIFYDLIDKFLATEKLAVMDIWGHSWEMGDPEKWAETEKFFKLLSGQKVLHYTSHIDFVIYLNAYKQLIFNPAANTVQNPTKVTLFFKRKGKVHQIKPGATLLF